MNKYQRVIFQSADQKFARVSFTSIFSLKEWSEIQAQHKNGTLAGLSDETMEALSKLIWSPNGKALGWYQADKFETTTTASSIIEHTKPTPEGLGWTAREALVPFEKEIVQFLDTGSVKTEWRLRRENTRESIAKYYTKRAIPNPFSGWKSLQRLMKGSIIVEQPADLLAMPAAVVYSSIYEGYLTHQQMWKPLNRAKVFASIDDANEYLKDNANLKSQGGGVALELVMQVGPVNPTLALGNKMRQALSQRDGETLGNETPVAQGKASLRRM